MRLSSILLAALIAGGVALWLFADELPFVRAADGERRAAAAVNGATTTRSAPRPEGSPAVSSARPVSVVALASRARPLSDQLVLRGRTEADRKVEVKAQTSGLVISAPKQKGAHVAKGDVLCEIELGEREAALTEAKAQLERAGSDANASRRLSRRGYSSTSDVVKDQAALEAARAAVARMELDIARTKVVAPFDGVLESDSAEFGALLQTGDVCATVITLDPIVVVGFAPERVVDALKVGLEGRARLITGREFAVSVAFVARSADPETRTFKVEATGANKDEAVRDGMTAELILPLAEGRAHLAPASALTLNDQGALGVRLAVSDPSSSTGRVARFAPVTLLRDGAAGVWLGGLPETADIIVVGQEFVTDASPVTVTYRAAPSAAAAD